MRIIMVAALVASLAACGSPGKGTEHPAGGGSAGNEVKPIPEGFHSVTPSLVVRDVDAAVEYYERAFGAELASAMNGPDGKTMHAEVRIGDSIVMLSPEMGSEKAPTTLGGTCGGLLLYVEDADAVFAAATAAGGKEKMPVAVQFWGDRYGQVTDPDGHVWSISTHMEELTEEEMLERAGSWMKAMAEGKAPPSFPKGTPAKGWKPDGYFTVTPALVLSGGEEQIAFYEKAFGAVVAAKMTGEGGKLVHLELRIGDSLVMMSTEEPDMQPDAKAPKNLGGTPLSLLLYVENASAAQAVAKEAGAIEKAPIELKLWGDMWGLVEDPSGHAWGIGTHVEDLTPEQIDERMKEEFPPVV